MKTLNKHFWHIQRHTQQHLLCFIMKHITTNAVSLEITVLHWCNSLFTITIRQPCNGFHLCRMQRIKLPSVSRIFPWNTLSDQPVIVWQDNMDSRAWLADFLDVLLAQSTDAIRVGASGVDHTLSLDVPLSTRKSVLDVRSSHTFLSIIIGCFQQADHFCVVCHGSAITHRCDGQGHVHARVVMLTWWEEATQSLVKKQRAKWRSG